MCTDGAICMVHYCTRGPRFTTFSQAVDPEQETGSQEIGKVQFSVSWRCATIRLTIQEMSFYYFFCSARWICSAFGVPMGHHVTTIVIHCSLISWMTMQADKTLNHVQHCAALRGHLFRFFPPPNGLQRLTSFQDIWFVFLCFFYFFYVWHFFCLGANAWIGDSCVH